MLCLFIARNVQTRQINLIFNFAFMGKFLHLYRFVRYYY